MPRLCARGTVCSLALLVTLGGPMAGAVAQTAHAAPAARTRGQAAISPEDSARFDRAMELEDGGNTDAAEHILVTLRKRYPNSFPIAESLGLLYASANSLDRALPLLQQAERLNPADARAVANLGTAYLKLGQVEKAIATLGRAARMDPQNVETASALGQALLLAKRPCEAADTFANVSSLPVAGTTDLPYNTGVALFQCGRYAEVDAALAHMRGLDSSAPAQLLLADAEEKTRHFEDAARHYLRAAQIEPSESNLYTLGEELLRHWSFDPAIQTFQTGVERFPQSRRMKTGLGIAFYGAARYSDAVRIFSGLLESDPGNETDAEIFGRACTVLTTADAPACSQLEPLGRQHPSNANLNLYAAIAILQQPSDPDRLQTAQQLLGNAIAANPALAAAYYRSGALLQQQNQWEASVTPLQKALSLDPQLAAAHYHLGLAYRRLGHKDEAAREMVLSRNEGEQQRNNLNARMQQITTLLVNSK